MTIKQRLIRIVLFLSLLILYTQITGVVFIGYSIPQLPSIVMWLFAILGLVGAIACVFWYWQMASPARNVHISLPDKSIWSTIWWPLLGYVILILLQLFMPSISESQNQEKVIDMVLHSPFLAVVYVGILAPILEELLFRGLIAAYFFPHLDSTNRTVLYLSVSSSLFSLIHMPTTLVHFFLYFLMGLVFGWIFLAKKDIRYSMCLHMFNNLLSVCVILFLS